MTLRLSFIAMVLLAGCAEARPDIEPTGLDDHAEVMTPVTSEVAEALGLQEAWLRALPWGRGTRVLGLNGLEVDAADRGIRFPVQAELAEHTMHAMRRLVQRTAVQDEDGSPAVPLVYLSQGLPTPGYRWVAILSVDPSASWALEVAVPFEVGHVDGDLLQDLLEDWGPRVGLSLLGTEDGDVGVEMDPQDPMPDGFVDEVADVLGLDREVLDTELRARAAIWVSPGSREEVPE